MFCEIKGNFFRKGIIGGGIVWIGIVVLVGAVGRGERSKADGEGMRMEVRGSEEDEAGGGEQEREGGKYGEVLEEIPITERERMSLEGELGEAMRGVSGWNQGDLEGAIEGRIEELGKQGYVVTDGRNRYNMENYKRMERFAQRAQEGERAKVDLYEVIEDGSLICLRFQAVEGGIELISGQMGDGETVLAYSQKYQLVRWEYTEKGYWVFEQNVKEEEERNGVIMIRVKPLPKKNRELGNHLIEPVGYQGNNMFINNWDEESLDLLNWNDLFPYLYQLAFQKSLDSMQYPEGIPEKLFEKVVSQYFPVEAAQIREMAVYNSKNHSYPCNLLGCGNFYASGYETPVPEVIEVKEEPDGILELTVDAVLEGQGNDKAFTHIVRIRPLPDNQYHYLSNDLLQSNQSQLPEYRERIIKSHHGTPSPTQVPGMGFPCLPNANRFLRAEVFAG